MATKQAYQQKLQAQLNEWDAKLDVLTAQSQKVSADLRITYENELAQLKAQRTGARKSLDELAQRGETAWEDMKAGTEKAWAEMGKTMETIASRFKA